MPKILMATMREARLKDIRNIITDEKGKDEALPIILDFVVKFAQSNPKYRRALATITASFVNQKTTKLSLEETDLKLPGSRQMQDIDGTSYCTQRFPPIVHCS